MRHILQREQLDIQPPFNNISTNNNKVAFSDSQGTHQLELTSTSEAKQFANWLLNQAEAD